MSDFASILLRLSQVPKLGSVRIQQILAHVNIDVLLNDIKGQVIEMKDVFIEEKEVPVRDEKTDEVIYNEETGEVETKIHFRTIIYATDGQTYVSSAYGIYNSLKQIIPVFGNPSEENIIKVRVGEKATRNGRKSLILTVEK